MFDIDDKIKILNSIKYIDEVICFDSQEEVMNWLKKNKVDRLFTGKEYQQNQPLDIFFEKENIFYHDEGKFRSNLLKANFIDQR